MGEAAARDEKENPHEVYPVLETFTRDFSLIFTHDVYGMKLLVVEET